jgi:hypothetical protein
MTMKFDWIDGLMMIVMLVPMGVLLYVGLFKSFDCGGYTQYQYENGNVPVRCLDDKK